MGVPKVHQAQARHGRAANRNNRGMGPRRVVNVCFGRYAPSTNALRICNCFWQRANNDGTKAEQLAPAGLLIETDPQCSLGYHLVCKESIGGVDAAEACIA